MHVCFIYHLGIFYIIMQDYLPCWFPYVTCINVVMCVDSTMCVDYVLPVFVYLDDYVAMEAILSLLL